MARHIHRIDSTSGKSVALIETASSGGSQYARPVTLQTVTFAPSDMERLFSDTRIAKNPRFTVIETWSVDGRSQGPNSRYGKTKAAMLEELAGHLPAATNNDRHRDVSTVVNPTPEDLQKFRAEMQAEQLASDLPRIQSLAHPAIPAQQPKVQNRRRL